MEGAAIMVRKSLRIFALVAGIALAIGAVFSGKVVAFFQHEHTSASSAQKSAVQAKERKVLYWYDAMDPQHKYNRPGKAPDGMDLVPKYADEASAGESPGPSAGGGNTSSATSDRKVLYWYDAMNPQRTYNKPGKAPDGMDLVPKYAEGEDAGTSNMAVGTIKISPQKQQLIGVQTTPVRHEALVRTVRTTGQITADETRIAHVHVKINGFIEDVFVDYVGQLVKKGQPLFTVYSPDLVSTQEEYLIAKRGDKYLGTSQFADVSQGARSLLRSARERLKLWDISDDQIKRLDETGEVSRTLTFYSPISGFVMDRKAFPQTSITPDMDLYQITDLSIVWVNADVYEYEVPFVRVGQQAVVQLSYYPGKSYTGKIAYIYPTVDPMTRTVKVRIELSNREFELKPQMLANVQLNIDYGHQVVIPQEAVLDSGDKQYVFVVHNGGVFEPRTVQLGAKFESKVAVLSGLKTGETIVMSGNFLIDSESRLKSAMGGMKH
jgi:membrane fusion protein, copper/silver efflux system